MLAWGNASVMVSLAMPVPDPMSSTRFASGKAVRRAFSTDVTCFPVLFRGCHTTRRRA